MDESLLNEFFADTQGHLDNIEEDTLKLEKSPSDAELIGDVFRRVHSIKGNAGIIGLGGIYAFGQEFEAFLEGIRDRKTSTPGEIEKIFRYLDGLKAQIGQMRGEPGGGGDTAERDKIPQENGDAEEDEEPEESEAETVSKNGHLAPSAATPASSAPAGAARSRGKAAEAGPVTVLTFELGEELYGIDIQRVKEIITYERITRVPNTLEFVDGVMNLRDQVIPVFDLRKKLRIKAVNGASKARGEKSIIVVEISKVATGLAVDEVTGIRVFDPSSITAPDFFAGRISIDYLLGVGQSEEGAVIILDAADLCDPAEMLY
jgi:purine-binding chemotaxis protein CheW